MGGSTLPEGMTYAQYAQRGAYPLIVTALLAAVFVLATFRPGETHKDLKWSRRLVFVWLLQNVFFVISAGWRLWLYVEVYTLTRWRVAAAIWMLLVACGLLWILVRIAVGRSNLWLINVNALTASVVLFVCTFLNMDGAIAAFNVRHCEEIRGKGAHLTSGGIASCIRSSDGQPDRALRAGVFFAVGEKNSATPCRIDISIHRSMRVRNVL
jgi:hypothetical protein